MSPIGSSYSFDLSPSCLIVLKGIFLFDFNSTVSTSWISFKFRLLPIHGKIVCGGGEHAKNRGGCSQSHSWCLYVSTYKGAQFRDPHSY